MPEDDPVIVVSNTARHRQWEQWIVMATEAQRDRLPWPAIPRMQIPAVSLAIPQTPAEPNSVPNPEASVKKETPMLAPRFRIAEIGAADGVFLEEPIFDTPAAAAAYCKAEKATGRSLKIVREFQKGEITAAQRRERARLRNGEYSKLPQWFLADYSKRNQFPHWATNEVKARAGFLAYSPTIDALVNDKQTVLLASSYLAKEFPELSSDQISSIHGRLVAEYDSIELKFTRDPDIVRDAYVDREHAGESSDYSSCMRYSHLEFNLPASKHPTLAYVGENSTFSLAYLQKVTDGDITARAVVSHVNKTFVRVYGYQESDKSSLIYKLEQAGYKRVKGFAGERLHLEKHPRQSRKVIMPYMDGQDVSCMPDGLICKGSQGAIICDVTAGSSRIETMTMCLDCSESFRRSTMQECRPNEFRCCDCTNLNWYMCAFNSTWYNKVENPPVDVYYFSYYREEVLAQVPQILLARYAFFCGFHQKYFSKQNGTSYEVVTKTGQQSWCQESTRPYTFVYGGVRYAWDMREQITGEPNVRPYFRGDILKIMTKCNALYQNCDFEVGQHIRFVSYLHERSRPSFAVVCCGLSEPDNWAGQQYIVNRDIIMNSSVELVTKVEDIPPPIFKVGDLVYFDTLKYTDPDEASLVKNCPSEAALQITKLEEINSDLIKATLVLPPNTRGSSTRNRNATYDCYTKYLSFVPGHGG